MIKHIVMWKLKNEFEGKSKASVTLSLIMELEHLKEKIVQIKALKTALNNNPDNEYDVLLEIEFETMEDLHIYQKHPEHLKVVEYLKIIRESKASIDYVM